MADNCQRMTCLAAIGVCLVFPVAGAIGLAIIGKIKWVSNLPFIGGLAIVETTGIVVVLIFVLIALLLYVVIYCFSNIIHERRAQEERIAIIPASVL